MARPLQGLGARIAETPGFGRVSAGTGYPALMRQATRTPGPCRGGKRAKEDNYEDRRFCSIALRNPLDPDYPGELLGPWAGKSSFTIRGSR
ncbi:MAG: hypothetical protein KatS3mg051_2046 [Anaerolineae bacterium]|nr:MAG: hypothetical protein KatS3mg051_2046 [Anaerolineae bacterium]